MNARTIDPDALLGLSLSFAILNKNAYLSNSAQRIASVVFPKLHANPDLAEDMLADPLAGLKALKTEYIALAGIHDASILRLLVLLRAVLVNRGQYDAMISAIENQEPGANREPALAKFEPAIVEALGVCFAALSDLGSQRIPREEARAILSTQ